MKNNIAAKTCEEILDDVNPGLMRRLAPKFVKKTIEQWKKNKTFSTVLYLINRFKNIAVAYMDTVKDWSLIAFLLAILPISFSTFTNFTTQIVFLLIVSASMHDSYGA